MKVIVSLTSTAQRLHLCRISIISLATQIRVPDRIILNLSKEPYLRDSGINKSDIKLLEYLTLGMPSSIKKIIEINWVENTGPYRKLIPTLLKADSSDIIVTADDDIFYHPQWLEFLLKDFNPLDKTVHASRVRYKAKNKLNKHTGYIYWPIIKKDKILSDNDWIITFGGGAVVSKTWFSDELLQDNSYLTVAPTADDLWFSKICQISNLKVRVVKDALGEISSLVHNDGLINHNFPKVKNSMLSKAIYYLLDSRLNYLGLKKYGNDIAYYAIENHFTQQAH